MRQNEEGGRRPQERPCVVGLTGTIAAGKSTIRGRLEKRGWPCIDADRVGHIVVEDMKQELAAEFGTEILEAGHVSRPKLGSIVFKDEEKLAKLNAMTHPVICQRIDEWIQKQTADIVVVEAIELLRSELKDMTDVVWVVCAQPEVRVQRMMQERGLSQEAAWARVQSQQSDEAYQRASDVSFDGSGEVAELNMQCDEKAKALEEEVKRYKTNADKTN